MLRRFMHSPRLIAALTRLLIALAACYGSSSERCAASTAPVTLREARPAASQDQDLLDRPISEIAFRGLSRVSEQLVRNNIRCAIGDAFDPAVVSEDVRLLTRLGQFRFVDARAGLLADGSVRVLFEFQEQQIIREIQVTGNRLINDQELIGLTRIRREQPRDDFQIAAARRAIADRYKQRGHYLTTVTVDERSLDEMGVLIFRILEGPRVRVKAITFEGASAFAEEQLQSQIKTRTAIPFFRAGALDEDVLAADLGALDRYYKDRGYLDVRVDRRIDISPDNREAKVIFVLAEGRQYTLRNITVVQAGGAGAGKPTRVFSGEQIQALSHLKPGDVAAANKLEKSRRTILEAYQELGRVDVSVDSFPFHASDAPVIDLEWNIDEGQMATVGEVRIQGNFLTKDRVIRRELHGVRPDRPYNIRLLNDAERRLRDTRLFGDVKMAMQAPDPEDPLRRDLLIEVQERNTGSVNFAVAFGSDSGAFGEISVVQNNFDITDVPETLEELFGGRAFRGAGQRFSMALRPGTEIFQFAVGLTDPHIFDSAYSTTVGASFRDRIYNKYDERRLSFPISVSRQIGDRWTIGGRAGFNKVELRNINADAPTEAFEDAGPNDLYTVGLSLTRTTITSIARPGSGSRLELGVEQTVGDYSFTTLNADYTVFLTLDEDFLERKTTLKLNTRMGYVFGERTPIYDRFYLGGRSFRGFEFRTISPKGIRADTGGPSSEAVGGNWMFFAGAQYEFPLIERAISGVFFLDTGTVEEYIGFDAYRVSIGFGLRLSIPQLGPVPIAFDFGFPLLSQDTDEEQVFSFTAELPFN